MATEIINETIETLKKICARLGIARDLLAATPSKFGEPAHDLWSSLDESNNELFTLVRELEESDPESQQRLVIRRRKGIDETVCVYDHLQQKRMELFGLMGVAALGRDAHEDEDVGFAFAEIYQRMDAIAWELDEIADLHNRCPDRRSQTAPQPAAEVSHG